MSDAGASGAAAAPAGEPAGGGRRSSNRRAIAIAVLAVLGLVVVVALAGGNATPPGSPTFPPVGVTAGPAGGAAVATRAEVARALSTQGLQSEDPVQPYRPAESPRFATAGRVVLRAILPDDPDHGLIVIYEFTSPADALAAAQEQAAYVTSGVGLVQFPPDARFVLRVVGATAVFFAWSPANAPDGRIEAIPGALETIGIGVPVPN